MQILAVKRIGQSGRCKLNEGVGKLQAEACQLRPLLVGHEMEPQLLDSESALVLDRQRFHIDVDGIVFQAIQHRMQAQIRQMQILRREHTVLSGDIPLAVGHLPPADDERSNGKVKGGVMGGVF